MEGCLGSAEIAVRKGASMELGAFSISLAVKDLAASKASTRSSVSRPSPETRPRTG
jgi:hypothetical protein